MASPEGATAADAEAHRDAEYERVWAARAERNVASVNGWDDGAGKTRSQDEDTPYYSATPTSDNWPIDVRNQDAATPISSNDEYNFPPKEEIYEDPYLSPPPSPRCEGGHVYKVPLTVNIRYVLKWAALYCASCD